MDEPLTLHLGVLKNREGGNTGKHGPGLWRDEYLKNRYLKHATHEELTNRLDDSFVNMIRFTDESKAVVRTPVEKHPLAALFGHVLHELGLRGAGDYAFSVKSLHFDDTAYPNIRRAAELWRGRNLKPGSYMLKFGKVKYLEHLLNKGEMRICPASFYREPSLVRAIRDDELHFTQTVRGGTVKIQDHDGTWRTASTVGAVLLTHTANSDYYLSCHSVLFENRLFDDFNADGCLIIKDMDRFGSCLRNAVRAILPDCDCFIGGVQYRDPYFPTKNPNVVFTKHFRYSYQRELRIIWGPPKPQENLTPIHVRMGALSSFCELMRLDDADATLT